MATTSPRALLERLLSPAEARTTIPAPRDDVFAVVSDPETYPDWLAGAQRIRHVDVDFPRPGAAFDHEVGPTKDTTVADDSTSLIVDPPHRLQLEVHVGPITGIVDFELVAGGKDTEVTLRESAAGRLGLAMPLLRLPIYLRNKASLAKLRQRFTALVVPL